MQIRDEIQGSSVWFIFIRQRVLQVNQQDKTVCFFLEQGNVFYRGREFIFIRVVNEVLVERSDFRGEVLWLFVGFIIGRSVWEEVVGFVESEMFIFRVFTDIICGCFVCWKFGQKVFSYLDILVFRGGLCWIIRFRFFRFYQGLT